MKRNGHLCADAFMLFLYTPLLRRDVATLEFVRARAMRLLYLEDEAVLARLVRGGLELAGFVVDWAATLEVALAAVRDSGYDLLIIDRQLPDGDGLTLVTALRARGLTMPIICATAQDKVAARIEGLNGGADDYIVKPIALGELVARIGALLRRPAALAPASYSVGNLELTIANRAFQVNGVGVPLSRREGLLLECLMRRAGQVIKRHNLQDALFGYDDDSSENAIEASVSRLRKWLVAAGADHRIATLRGVGYMLVP